MQREQQGVVVAEDLARLVVEGAVLVRGREQALDRRIQPQARLTGASVLTIRVIASRVSAIAISSTATAWRVTNWAYALSRNASSSGGSSARFRLLALGQVRLAEQARRDLDADLDLLDQELRLGLLDQIAQRAAAGA